LTRTLISTASSKPERIAIMNRRDFLGSCAAAAAFSGTAAGTDVSAAGSKIPNYLKGYEAEYRKDPRNASIKWFRDARFGLFMHFGVYSIVGMGEWVQLTEKIPVAEYAKLKTRFKAERFDADEIADMAMAAGMKYINMTARHHDSFCLFRTEQTDFNSLSAPAGRDLAGELVEACDKRGLGVFLYYSYGLDWKHPYFFSREASMKGPVQWSAARPDYSKPQPEYLFRDDSDFRHYIDFAHAQLEEILKQYRPLAGVWLDPIMGYYSRPDLFPIEETYRIIRSYQPYTLISFKQGASGDEDFTAPERNPRQHQQGGEVARIAWEKNQGKPIEICDTLQPRVWGYDMRNAQEHRNHDDVMKMLEHADSVNANLLLNTGPRWDGSIDGIDRETLLDVGKRIG